MPHRRRSWSVDSFSRIPFFREAASAKGGFIKTTSNFGSYQINQCNALRRVSGEKAPSYVGAPSCGFCKEAQRLDYAGLGFMKEKIIIDTRKIEEALCLATGSMPGKNPVVCRCFTNCSRARR